MTPERLKERLRELAVEELPLPGGGATAARHQRLFEVGREDLSLAKLAEAHWDAVAILMEAGREPQPGAVYGVWASEIPTQALALDSSTPTLSLVGTKPFCSGLGIVDRALVTVTEPTHVLMDIDLHEQENRIEMDTKMWATEAFRSTNTGSLKLDGYRVTELNVIGPTDFYLSRPGFWYGACGPAACWVGGAAGLASFAKKTKKDNPHILAHIGAMDATLWMMQAALEKAGNEIDRSTGDLEEGQVLALRLRHVVEQGCSDILHRFTRALGPHPLAMNTEISIRRLELELYLCQSHAERDLEQIGRVAYRLGGEL